MPYSVFGWVRCALDIPASRADARFTAKYHPLPKYRDYGGRMRSQSFTTVVGLCLAVFLIFIDAEVAIAYTINHTHRSWSALPFWQKLISLFWLGGQPNFFAIVMLLNFCAVAFGIAMNVRTTRLAYALLHYRIPPVRRHPQPLLPSLRLGDWPLTAEQRAEYLGMGRGCFIVEATADNRVRYVEQGSSLEFGLEGAVQGETGLLTLATDGTDSDDRRCKKAVGHVVNALRNAGYEAEVCGSESQPCIRVTRPDSGGRGSGAGLNGHPGLGTVTPHAFIAATRYAPSGSIEAPAASTADGCTG